MAGLHNSTFLVMSYTIQCLGRYVYTEDLLAKDSCRPVAGSEVLQKRMQDINTPLQWQRWDKCLVTHPDQEFRQYIVNGIRSGFGVGFDYSHSCRSSGRTLASTSEHTQVVRDYLAAECAAGRVIGPLAVSDFPQVQLWGDFEEDAR